MEPITILIGNNEIPAELNDSETALTIAEALPFEGMASVWGEEIYFEIPVQIDEAPDAYPKRETIRSCATISDIHALGMASIPWKAPNTIPASMPRADESPPAITFSTRAFLRSSSYLPIK